MRYVLSSVHRFLKSRYLNVELNDCAAAISSPVMLQAGFGTRSMLAHTGICRGILRFLSIVKNKISWQDGIINK